MTRFLLVVACTLFLTACAGGGFQGYKIKPYSIRGVRYHPMPPRDAVGHMENGVASHYSEHFLLFPGKTATGENLWPWTRAAAHKTLPIPCVVRVTNLKNGKSTKVRVNDRGPFIRGRMLDVTKPVADELGFTRQGLTDVRIEVLSVGDGPYKITRHSRHRPLPR